MTPPPAHADTSNEHGERLARVEAQGESMQANIRSLTNDVHGILSRLDGLAILVTRAVEALHTPMTCPNGGRIADTEQRVSIVEQKMERARGGGAVLYWLLGALLAAALVWLGSVLK
jgi:hypothetical protein